mmetsp:Transcript_8193/g.26172  ORF Transcript_8193/g.26172 Transcript_8193/m.26172 type:complete len:307 (+) Transcript_8193:1733-2653(+)
MRTRWQGSAANRCLTRRSSPRGAQPTARRCQRPSGSSTTMTWPAGQSVANSLAGKGDQAVDCFGHVGVGATQDDTHVARRVEALAGQDDDTLVGRELLAKLHVVLHTLRQLDEAVHGGVRRDRHKLRHLGKLFDDGARVLLVQRDEVLKVGTRRLVQQHRHQRLHERARANDDLASLLQRLVDLSNAQGLVVRIVHDDPPKTPPGQAELLGNATARQHCHLALEPLANHLGDGHVASTIVHNVSVHLVGDNGQLSTVGNLRDGQQVVLGVHGPARVRRVVHNDGNSVLVNLGVEIFEVDLPPTLGQ